MHRIVRLALSLFLGAGIGSFRTDALSAQSAVQAVRLFADLATDDGSAIVEVEVDLVADDTAGLRIELLGFGRGVTDGFMAGGLDGPLVRFEDRSGSRQWVLVERSAFESHGLERVVGVGSGGGAAGGSVSAGGPAGSQQRDPTAGTDSVWRLRAAWVVTNARFTKGESVLVHVPVLTVALPPVRDGGDVFHATVRVPSNWSVTEAFPAGLRESAGGTYSVDLAVAPSVVSLRARTDGAWRPGVPLLLDILAGIILLGFVVVGLRWLGASVGVAGRGAGSAVDGASTAVRGARRPREGR